MQVSLSKEVQDFITSYSLKHNISHSQLIEEAIIRMIEDIQDLKIGVDSYEEFLKNKEKGIKAQELFNEMQIGGEYRP